MTIPLAVISGFLGAGKTTLILAAARILRARGLRPAVILNDQAGDLVDTRLVQASGLDCGQVTGGCFCCRLPDLIDSAERLLAVKPDIIFAEAVGSCTDIVATTLRPLLRDHGADFRTLPLTVAAHPQAVFDDPDLAFLHRNQLAEADIIYERGHSVEAWLDRLMDPATPVGDRHLEIDYRRYAEAEAALAWMNLRVTARSRTPISAPMLIGPLLDRLEPQVRIVHLKIFAESEAGYLKAALTANGQEPAVEGALDASPAAEHEIVLNVRALNDPAELRATVEREFAALPARLTWHQFDCFRPSPPVPYLRL